MKTYLEELIGSFLLASAVNAYDYLHVVEKEVDVSRIICTLHAVTATYCFMQCQQDSDCNNVAFKEQPSMRGSTCYFLKKGGERPISGNSMMKLNVLKPTCDLEYNVRYPANDVNEDGYKNKVRTWKECAQKCVAEVRCKFFTLNHKNQCYLKTKKGERFEDFNYVSGSKACGY